MRIRFEYGRTEEAEFVSHLDLMRSFERAIRRAGLPVAFSVGFNPQMKVAIAAPLPVGVVGRRELMDVQFAESVEVEATVNALASQMPVGLEIYAASAVDEFAPSLQASLRECEYEVVVRAEAERVGRVVEEFLGRDIVVVDRKGKHGRVTKDIRGLVGSVDVVAGEGGTVVRMVLAAGPTGGAKASEVLSALELSEEMVRVERTRLVFGE